MHRRLLRPSGKRRGKRTSQRGQQEAAAVHPGMVERLSLQPAALPVVQVEGVQLGEQRHGP
jgi:hypothetical protein